MLTRPEEFNRALLAFLGGEPVGNWRLDLSPSPNARAAFESGEMDDVLLLLTLSGRRPAWPE